jgi:hypothetical protein
MQGILSPEKAAGAAEGDTRKLERRGSTKMNQPTLSAQFKKQLAALVETLQSSEPHFVRCVKSNDQKKATIFESTRVMQQLRYVKMLKTQFTNATRKPHSIRRPCHSIFEFLRAFIFALRFFYSILTHPQRIRTHRIPLLLPRPLVSSVFPFSGMPASLKCQRCVRWVFQCASRLMCSRDVSGASVCGLARSQARRPRK